MNFERDSNNFTHKKRKKKSRIVKPVMLLVRRIHLFSGLFMLPWVLLYGFTALLFNHPTYMAGSKTNIRHFELDDIHLAKLPSANGLARLAVNAANEKFAKNGDSKQRLILNERCNAFFSRRAFGSVKNDEKEVSVIVDLNSGEGYVRSKIIEPKAREADKVANDMQNGMALTLNTAPVEDVRNGVSNELEVEDLGNQKLNFRSLPAIEFSALLDGQPVNLKFVNKQQRRGNDKTKTDSEAYGGGLTQLGANPRELSARSYLLRLHMAHGYPLQFNARWFWAIAVDVMFGSMVFWGLSGVFMWWQIKRTRLLGFSILIISAILAAWLAVAMHWQLVNG